MDQLINPKILQKKRWQRRAKVISALSIVLILGVVFFRSVMSSVNANDIRIDTVKRIDLQTSLTANGLVEPIRETSVVSKIDSQISSINAQIGQEVSKGQILMALDTTQVQLSLENLKEQIALKQNQIKSQNLLLSRQVNEAKGKLELLAVDLESRQTRLERLQQLSSIGGVAKHDLTEAGLNVKRTSIEIRQYTQQIKDLNSSAHAQIEGLKLEQSMLEKSHQEQQRLLSNAVVKAPSDGYLTWINKQLGSAVMQGDPLVKIADISAFKLSASLSDFYSDQLWQGMPITFKTQNTIFNGVINSIISAEQAGVLSLTIDLASDTDFSLLRLKQRIDVQLITGTIEDALVVSKGPFVNGSGLKKVFVLDDDHAIGREVRVANGNQHYYQIKQGLAVGETIIVSDISAFREKDQVKIL